MPFCHLTLKAEIRPQGYPKQLNDLGDLLRARRLNLGLTIKESAAQIGCNVCSLANWEKKRTEVALPYRAAVVRFVGLDPTPAPSTVGQAVAAARIARGWSRKQLASRAGTDPATVTRVEQDTPRLAKRPLHAILSTLDLIPVLDLKSV